MNYDQNSAKMYVRFLDSVPKDPTLKRTDYRRNHEKLLLLQKQHRFRAVKAPEWRADDCEKKS